MWFAAMSSPHAHPWFIALVSRLLQNDARTTKLLRHNPFPGEPPNAIRALLYRYQYSTWRELRETGAWWQRTLVTEYLPPVWFRSDQLRASSRNVSV
jgi:hypothetical protein